MTDTPNKGQENIQTDNDKSRLAQIFRYRGEKLYLHESRLKANSKSDYAGRLTILYLYYKYTNRETEVSRAETNDFLKGEGFDNDGNYRKWISSNKSLYNINDSNYCLCQEGIERAKEYLADVFDESKTDVWTKGSKTKTGAKTTAKISSSKATGRTAKNHSYSLVTDIDFIPKGKDSLKDFIKKYTPSNSQTYNTLFVYYLRTILKLQNIGENHIYTCYKHIGVKFPNNLYQSLVDTARRKGWIDTSSIKDIKLTTSGENAVEHELNATRK